MAAGGDGRPFDALVLGAGIQGSCAAYQLARRRLKTLLLDQFPLPHTRGSSHGQSRISRSAYPQDIYLALMAEAKRLWGQLEAEAGAQLHRIQPTLYSCQSYTKRTDEAQPQLLEPKGSRQ